MKQTLADVTATHVWDAQQAALMRLHLYVIGATHALWGDFLARARSSLTHHAGEDGTLDGLGFLYVQQELAQAWRTTFERWQALFQAARFEAAALPLGSLAVLHRAYVKPVLEEAEGQQGPNLDALFRDQVQLILEAADQRLYQDGIPLSSRIWNLNAESLEGINRTLAEGVASQNSAINLAKKLEQYLGVGQACPRWTRSRLYGLTKQQIADGDRSGLYSGEDCRVSGISPGTPISRGCIEQTSDSLPNLSRDAGTVS